MTNPGLARDYRVRARGRRKAIEVLLREKLFADVVRECQEACELGLKSIIREAGHAVPMTHDVSQKLKEIERDLPESIRKALPRLMEISRQLRRDRELAFYGSEDVTPSEFFQPADAARAIAQLDEVLALLPPDK